MYPLIQYATTSDSVSIAFWTLGSGPPAIFLPALPFANLQVEWEMPAYRRWFERLAERRTMIHYDSRGTGLSDRDVPDLSLDARLSDIDAVSSSPAKASYSPTAANLSCVASLSRCASSLCGGPPPRSRTIPRTVRTGQQPRRRCVTVFRVDLAHASPARDLARHAARPLKACCDGHPHRSGTARQEYGLSPAAVPPRDLRTSSFVSTLLSDRRGGEPRGINP